MQKALILIGTLLIALGLLWPWVHKVGLGRLPGDIVVEGENYRLYFPFTTMIIVSLVITVVLWLLRR